MRKEVENLINDNKKLLALSKENASKVTQLIELQKKGSTLIQNLKKI